ncbi:MAG: FeS-binding protein [Candidatus Rokuibacteriota bacterium]|nr:MAG: FeS-binding protein [Candidatus Rokubacteria bacterium]
MLTMPRIRVRLTFPPEQIQQPIVYHLVKDFDLIPNIRRAEVKADYGWMALELEGDEGALERAVAWLKGRGVQVDPIERDVIVP